MIVHQWNPFINKLKFCYTEMAFVEVLFYTHTVHLGPRDHRGGHLKMVNNVIVIDVSFAPSLVPQDYCPVGSYPGDS